MKLCLAIFGLAVGCAVAAAAGELVRITEHRDANGKSTYWFIKQERLSKIPEWKVDGPLPLPVEKAVAKATEWIKKRNAKFTEWDIVSISLGKIWDSDTKNRWYYSVSVNGTVVVDGIKANSFFSVIILMDGTIVEPTGKE
jgi:hypothetical protein